MILEIDGIELSFNDRKILNGIYLKAEMGKVTGVLGRNGSGKTSLLRILFGDLKPKYKNIRKNGEYHKGKLYRTGSIAFLPQHQLLPGSLPLKEAFQMFGVDWKAFIALFETFFIYEKAKANKLSSGELRVVETYLVLCSNREIIMLDEPFSFIAPIHIEKIKKLIEQKKRHSALIVTDHFYRDILEVSDAVYLLKNGYSKLITSSKDLENEGYLMAKF